MTTDGLVTLAQIEAARALIGDAVHRTPLLSSATAARVVEVATGVRPGDGRVYLKAEHLQKTGSFKPRGMTARVASLSAAERARGIISFSAGNAAQGYAAMERIRDERGLVLCHPFDDAEVVAGHGSVGLEMLEDLPDLDVVVCGIGGGGLISGVAAAIREQRPQVRVYGVEPTGSDAMSRALEAGQPVPLAPRSVADGLNAPFAGERTLAMVRRYLEEVVRIEDAEILSGVRFGMERLKQVLEPAGAAALAALLHGRIPVRRGERVAVVLSGGNLDLAKAGELLEAAAPLPA